MCEDKCWVAGCNQGVSAYNALRSRYLGDPLAQGWPRSVPRLQFHLAKLVSTAVSAHAPSAMHRPSPSCPHPATISAYAQTAGRRLASCWVSGSGCRWQARVARVERVLGRVSTRHKERGRRQRHASLSPIAHRVCSALATDGSVSIPTPHWAECVPCFMHMSMNHARLSRLAARGCSEGGWQMSPCESDANVGALEEADAVFASCVSVSNAEHSFLAAAVAPFGDRRCPSRDE